MSRKAVKRVVAVLAAGILLCAGVFALRKGLAMYRSIHTNINSSRESLESQINLLESAVDSLEGEVRLSNQDLYMDTTLDYSWAENNSLIAHALGGLTIDDYTYDYTNSLEAFQDSYAKDFRIFEADLLLSSDGCLVAAHDWERYGWEEAPTLTEFIEGSFYDGKITQLTASDLIDLMIQYPDIYVVTDTKYTDLTSYRLQFSQLIYLAQQKGDESVLDRFVVQVYSQSMYELLYQLYPWKSVIYTLYQTDDSVDDALAFCKESGIGVITVNYWGITQEEIDRIHAAELKVYAFTVNDPDDLEAGILMGLDGFYTDSATP